MTEELARARGSADDSILRATQALGDAWSWLILREAVLRDVGRFGEFQQRLGIARSTLSARLGQLGRSGVLVRQPTPGQDYVLTDAGRDFFGCLMVALRWGDQWRPLPDPPLVVSHLDCGHRVMATLRCGHCGEVLRATDVAATRTDVHAPEPAKSAARLRSPDFALLERVRPCSIAHTLTVTGDWWSGLLVREAFFGVRRFDELQRRLGVGPNILSGRLRRLIEVGVLRKVPYQSWPVRHEYRLTAKGLDFYHVPLAIATWGRRWLPPAEHEPRLVHTCGAEVQAVLSCAACGQPITRADVAV